MEMRYAEMNRTMLQEELAKQKKLYEEYQVKNFQYDMTRGKPGADQLDLSLPMLDCLPSHDVKAESGADYRNYGLTDGIPEAKKLMADLLGVEPSCVIVSGNSSLNIMYDIMAKYLLLGVAPGMTPWCQQGKIKFLCPAPGYDRHFAICEQFGMEMIPIEMKEDGPDMDEIERLVKTDASIKGMWSVPKYSNPTGVIYSDEVITRLASMECAAEDFRIFWDDAYTVHILEGEPVVQKNLILACAEAGHPDRTVAFTSTSKITFPGAGISAVASSREHIAYLCKLTGIQTIGPDKLNELRHVRFLKDYDGVVAHMKKHAALLKPKFDAVLNAFEEELGGLGILSWTKPQGGYFISIDTLDGCASRVVAMAKACGVAVTPAGSTYPCRKDPRDRNIRIAPSFPAIEDLSMAVKVLCVCVRICSLEKLMETAE